MATGIGESLRAARREHGRSLADAAAETRIRETYLAALEEEDFAALGGDVYVKGFLRSYAKFLGLDPEPLVESYRRDHEGFHELVPLAADPVQPMPRERQPGITVIVTAAGVLLLVLAFIGLLGGDGDDSEETVAPGPPSVEEDDDTSDAATPAEPPAGENSGGDVDSDPDSDDADPDDPADGAPDDDAVAEPPDGIEVVVSVADGESWMRVLVDGQHVLEGPQGGGFTQTFEGDDEVFLRLGDPSVVSLVVNGEEQDELGAPGIPVNLSCGEGETTCDVESDTEETA